MKKVYILFLFSLTFLSGAFSQESTKYENWNMGVYATGGGFASNELESMDFIRDDFENSDSYSPSLYEDSHCFGIGAKVEHKIINNRFTFSAGIHYRKMLNKLYISHMNSDYMMINISETSESLNYIRVNSIDQEMNYLGTQVNAKINMLPGMPNFTVYINTGLDINFLISDEINTDFYNNDMSKYQSKIESFYDSPSTSFGVLNITGGVTLGNYAKPHASFEMGPGIRLYGETSCFSKPSGCFFYTELNFFIPLNF